ncbi:MAG: DUF3574 domain-containing protein [Alphaproteobacteria bacterium]|nr:DUF3574 domain-containing protein [Alphaproteobacteria bacterium]
MNRNAAAIAVVLLGARSFAACPEGMKPAIEAELFFGRDIGENFAVSDRDWRRFVADEISSRFPNGFTIEDARGQWSAPDGHIVRESSKHVTIVIEASGDAASIAKIRDGYKRRFHQDSVLLVEREVCSSF